MSGIVNMHYPFCGAAAPKLEFTYTGRYNQREDGVVELLTTGDIVFSSPAVIDIFCVGGGGCGGAVTGDAYSGVAYGYGGGGGGGGNCSTVKAISVSGSYRVVVGNGAKETEGSIYQTQNKFGETTSFGSIVSATGGMCAFTGFVGGRNNYERARAGNGGSGGGGFVVSSATAKGTGGSDGSSGLPGTGNLQGTGSGATTREFGESGAKLYAGGGAGGTYMVSDTPVYSLGGSGGGGAGAWCGVTSDKIQLAGAGGANTGGGGGGNAGYNAKYADGGFKAGDYGGAGGSGIVCIRVAR